MGDEHIWPADLDHCGPTSWDRESIRPRALMTGVVPSSAGLRSQNRIGWWPSDVMIGHGVAAIGGGDECVSTGLHSALGHD